MNNIQIPLGIAIALQKHCYILRLPDVSCFFRDAGGLVRWIAKTGALALLFFLPLLCRAENAPPLAPPPIAAKEAGEEYFPHLEKMEKYLDESKLLEFYLEAERFVRKIRFTLNEERIGIYQLKGKEEHVACEWFAYYLTKSPLFSDEIAQEISARYRLTDIQLKQFALDCILEVNFEKKSALLSVDKPKLRARYLSYAKVILKMLNTTRIELEKLEEQDWAKFREEETNKPKSNIYDDEAVWRQRAIEGKARELSLLRRDRSEECNHATEWSQRNLLYMLMAEYPNNAPRIHTFFFEIGYSKEKFVRKFRKKFGGNKKTEYLFKDLPKLKD
jgi:hypothetical protein